MRGDDFISFVGKKKKRVFVTVVLRYVLLLVFGGGVEWNFSGFLTLGIGTDGLFILPAFGIRVSLSDSSCLFFVCFFLLWTSNQLRLRTEVPSLDSGGGPPTGSQFGEVLGGDIRAVTVRLVPRGTESRWS